MFSPGSSLDTRWIRPCACNDTICFHRDPTMVKPFVFTRTLIGSATVPRSPRRGPHGQRQEVMLHETAVSWMRDKPAMTLPKLGGDTGGVQGSPDGLRGADQSRLRCRGPVPRLATEAGGAQSPEGRPPREVMRPRVKLRRKKKKPPRKVMRFRVKLLHLGCLVRKPQSNLSFAPV